MDQTFILYEPGMAGTAPALARAARRLGYRPVVVGAYPERFPWINEEALDTLVLDTTDLNTVLAECRAFAAAERVAGLYCPRDAFVEQGAIVAHNLGLPGLDPAAAHIVRSKPRQRQALNDAGLDNLAWAVAASPAQAEAAGMQIGFPVVVKPVGGTGSQGARLCHDAASVREQAIRILSSSWNRSVWNNDVLVEKAVLGPMFTAGLFDGRFLYASATRLSAPPEFIVIGQDYPPHLTPGQARQLEEFSEKIAQALGLSWGPINIEVKYDERQDRFHLIEANPRLDGGQANEALLHARGMDIVGCTIERCVGLTPIPAPTRNHAACLRYLILNRPSLVRSVQAFPFHLFPHIISAEPPRGRLDQPMGDYRDRVGHVIAVADSLALAVSESESAIAFMEREYLQ